jgi:hypothetical protein
MGPPDEGNGPAPLGKRAGPNEEAAAAKLPLSTNEVTGPTDRTNGSRAGRWPTLAAP